jgi:hypothetical protein
MKTLNALNVKNRFKGTAPEIEICELKKSNYAPEGIAALRAFQNFRA